MKTRRAAINNTMQRVPNKSVFASLVIRSMAIAICMLLPSYVPASVQTAAVASSEREAEGASVLLQKCSSCHAAPKPALHTANVWPSVVYRMQMHMTTQGNLPLTKDETKLLIEYLQRYASNPEDNR